MSRPIVVKRPCAVRRRLEKTVRKNRDPGYRIRARIVLLFGKGWTSPRIAEALGCATAMVVGAIQRFLEDGKGRVNYRRPDNSQPRVDEDFLQALAELVASSPEDFGRRRPILTRELLSKTLRDEIGVRLGVATVARMPRELGGQLGMARPTVARPWLTYEKSRSLNSIPRVIETLTWGEVAFFEDEVEIHPNLRVGRGRMFRGCQRTVLPPGRSQELHIARALSVNGGDLVCVNKERKSPDLFRA